MIRLFKVVMSHEAEQAVVSTLRSGWVAEGPAASRFERRLGQAMPVVLVNSGTSALELAYHLAGVGPGTRVLVPPATCIATALPLLHRGAEIVWVDVDPNTGLADAADVNRKLDGAKLVVAVDWGGHVCKTSYWHRGPTPLVIDSAHRLIDNDTTNVRGTYVCYSFQAIKFLTTGADGGALIAHCNTADRARRLRWFGFDRTSKEDFRSVQRIDDPGFKMHMSDVAAAIGMANLPAAHRALEVSQENARYYNSVLKPRGRLLYTPTHGDTSSHFWLYTILVEDRDAFVAFMKRRGIETSQVHSRIDQHPCFASRYGTPKLPGLDHFAAHQVSIPVGRHVTPEDTVVIANAVDDWAEGATR